MITPYASTKFEVPNSPAYIVASYRDDTRPMLPFTVAVQRINRPEPDVIHRFLTEPEGADEYRKLCKYWAARAKGLGDVAALKAMLD